MAFVVKRWAALGAVAVLPLAGLGVLGPAALGPAGPAGAIGATTWYVVQDGTGSACTEVTPCGTVSAAVSLASPGDTIEIAGTIDDHVTISSDHGTPTDRLTVEQWSGQPAAVVDGTGSGKVFTLDSGTGAVLNGLAIQDGRGTDEGGGVFNDGGTLTVVGSTFSTDQATVGGGIFNDNGTVTVESSTFSGNQAATGGGITNEGTLTVEDSTFLGNQADYGGGIDNDDGTAMVEASTFSDNQATETGGGLSNWATLDVEDSTFSGNAAEFAGGSFTNFGTATVESSTFSGNRAATGGIWNVGALSLAGDILAGATASGECNPSLGITDAGYNIDDDGSCGFSPADHSVSNSATLDASLGTLADNGGPTETVLPAIASPAARVIPPDTPIDGESTTLCTGTDQRGIGFPRPAAGASLCSIGAVEAPAGTAPTITSAAGTDFTVGTPGTFTVIATGVPTPHLTESGPLPGGVSFADNGDGTATLSGVPDDGTATTWPFTVTAGNEVTPDATQPFTLTVERVVPEITWPAPDAVPYGTALSGTQLDASATDPTSGNPVPGAFTYTPPAGTVLGAGRGQALSASFVPTDSADYADGGGGTTITVTKAPQTVAFTSAVPADAVVGGPGYVPTASATSGLAVTITLGPSSAGCTLTGDQVAFTSPGPCVLEADQGGNGNWGAAAPVTQAFPIEAGAAPSPTGTAGPTGSAFAATPDGGGWWVVHGDGGVFAYGDAQFYGSLPGLGVTVGDVVAVAGTPDGRGYWVVGADGGVFSFGDAQFYGSAGGWRLAQPVVGMAPTPDGQGYWLVAGDGGVFSFGDAGFYGSAGSQHLDGPAVGIAPTSDGQGYWLVAADGGVFAFGDAPFFGSLGGSDHRSPVLGLLPVPGGGYELVDAAGTIARFPG